MVELDATDYDVALQQAKAQPLFPHEVKVRGYNPDVRASDIELNEIIGGIIRERRSSGEPREDLLDMLLQARDADGNPMSDAQLRDEVMTLFLAGPDFKTEIDAGRILISRSAWQFKPMRR